MHDTHMIEKLYQSVVRLCSQHSIVKVNRLRVEVDEGSHLDGAHLLAHLTQRDSTLFSTETQVELVQKPYDHLTAIITDIDGDDTG